MNEPWTLIPKPVSAASGGESWPLAAAEGIYVEPAMSKLQAMGRYLAACLQPATGHPLPVSPLATRSPDGAGLVLTTAGGDPALGDEGYELSIGTQGMVLAAHRPAGLFWGIQTLFQLLPPEIGSETAAAAYAGPWELPTGRIRDFPRFAWRGAMLDVARHFFDVDDVKRYIDLIASYKMNVLHLHLTDDQGWRIAIQAWPDLAVKGGSGATGGDPGGYYTQAGYADIVAYAQSRYVTLVPEIDVPGHTNAALSSYAELNRDGVAPPPYTGIEVGFSSLAVDQEITFRFLEDVLRELSALTPGPYLHIGGDEAKATDENAYRAFIWRLQNMIQAHGKQMVGWEEITRCNLDAPYVAQYWIGNLGPHTAQEDARLVMSPASTTYLDMKYGDDTALGLSWAGTVDVRQAYEWEPTAFLAGLPASIILGVEAPLWTETLRTIRDVEFMAFPRLPGIAEIGWSPAEGRTWDEYRLRLAAHGPRLAARGVNFYRSPLVPWKEGI